MNKFPILIALIVMISVYAQAQSRQTKSLSKKSTATSASATTLPSIKELRLDKASLEKFKYRLEKQRDIGPLLKSLGPGTTGGGESCFQRVVNNYSRLVAGFRMGVLFNDSELDSNESLLYHLEKIEIQMGQDLKFEGRPVDALNVPSHHLVIIDYKVCSYLRDFEFDRRIMGLLLHEVYGVARIPDKKYEQSTRLLARIAEFADGLTDEEEPWLVMREFIKQVKKAGSPLEKLLVQGREDRDSRESINYKGIKIIKTGNTHEGFAMDYGHPECIPYEKKGHECATSWHDITSYYLVIVNKDQTGSGWRTTQPYYIKFNVDSSSKTLSIGDPETGKQIPVKMPPPKVTFEKILNAED